MPIPQHIAATVPTRNRPFNSDEKMRKEDDVAPNAPTGLDKAKGSRFALGAGTASSRQQRQTEPGYAEEALLNALALATLNQWPKYFLRIEGNTEEGGNYGC